MASKKKDLFNPIEQIQGILQKDQYLLDDSGDKDILYAEKPVDIITFVSSKDWLGIEPQKDPITGTQAPTPLSEAQLEFLEKATDFENGVTNLVLWV